MDLTFVQLVFEISADDGTELRPLLYRAVGGFRDFFRSSCCLKGSQVCRLCMELPEPCAYQTVFGQTLSTDPDVVRRHQKPSLPFVFKIGDSGLNSSSIELGVALIGGAIQYLSIFRNAIGGMIASAADKSRTDMNITGICCIDYQGGRHDLNSSGDLLTLLSGREILQASQDSETVMLSIQSPLRLLSSGSTLRTFDFGLLLRSQLRRCSSLFAYYGEGGLELDFTGISVAAQKVTFLNGSFAYSEPDWACHSSMGGLSGAGEFTGLTEGMLPLLKLGSYFNAGKGAVYGMGAYSVDGI